MSYLLPLKGLFRGYQRHALLSKISWVLSHMPYHFSPYFFPLGLKEFQWHIHTYISSYFSYKVFGGINHFIDLKVLDELISYVDSAKGECYK
jgi:hypothetical protein